jgi:NNP family nitrate/nitrite transporter-like MFS transporter
MVGLLPRFFGQTYGLSVTAAAAAGSAFAVTNLVARPGGGFLADRMCDRRLLLTVLLGASIFVCLVLTGISASWPLWAAMGLVAVAAMFLQACNGAVFAMVPLVNRRCGGQIAGLVGAFGNVGGIALSALTVFGYGIPVVFLGIAIAAVALTVLVRQLPSLEGGHAVHAEQQEPEELSELAVA